MPYLLINDFQYGMDRRRKRVSGIPGTLWSGKNVHITRGGDIARIKKFDPVYTLPAGTYGLARIKEQVYVFGSADLAASMPIGVNYQRLQSPAAATMVGVLDALPFDGQLYVIAEYDDGNLHHFYNGTRVSDWDTVADANATFDLLAEYLARRLTEDSAVSAQADGQVITITASVPGTDFTIAKSTVNPTGTADQDITLNTEVANVAAVAETQATGSVEVTGGSTFAGVNVISDITVDGVSLMTNPVSWTGSNDSTATLLSTEINNGTATHGYTASVAAAVVTLTAAPGTGATPNGHVVASVIPATSNVTTTDTNVSGGVAAVAAVAKVVTATISGTLDADDQFTITLNSVDYTATPRAAATGTSLYVLKGRVYSTAANLIRYCQINDATDWTTTTTTADAGFLTPAQGSDPSERLVAMTNYNNFTAIFGEDNIYIYSLSADNSLNSIISTLENTGTRAAASVVAYGNRDVFYLDESGIRSIQARDSSGDASVDDVGTVIDPFVQDYIDSIDESAHGLAFAAIEPKDNLYFLVIGSRVFVLSRYPAVKISAWSYLDPGVTFTGIVRTPRRLYTRDATKIYAYGGVSGDEYDDEDTNQPVIETPFVSARDEAGIKMLTGFDAAVTGRWAVEMLVDPNDETKVIDIGVLHRTTYGLEHHAAIGRSSHVAFKFTGTNDGAASLSSMAVHYEKEERR